MTLDRALSALGRFFVGAGVLVFLFIAFQLWGTNVTEARNQDKLRTEVPSLFANANQGPTTTSPGHPVSPTTTANTSPPPPSAPVGGAVAVIKIPKINLEKAVVEGTGVPDLKKGPGHYLNTPLPGQPGNAAIAGHRTTYGAPFGDIGELGAGDEIDVTTLQGSFRYRVQGQQIVDPTDISVLNPTKDNRLTLTTCHPKYSAAKRLVVTALLDTSPAPAAAPTTTTVPPGGSATSNQGTTTAPASPAVDLQGADLSGTPASKTPAFIWGLLTAVVGIAIYLLGRVCPKWLAYALGTPVFLVFLFVFFENFSRLLPANA